jgi:hypothetical protein
LIGISRFLARLLGGNNVDWYEREQRTSDPSLQQTSLLRGFG